MLVVMKSRVGELSLVDGELSLVAGELYGNWNHGSISCC
jgi:hypothetical protein